MKAHTDIADSSHDSPPLHAASGEPAGLAHRASGPAGPSSPGLARWLIVALAAALLLSAARAWWGWEAHRRLSRLLSAAAARGEPLQPAEFDPPTSLPVTLNAAYYLSQAHAAIGKSAPSPSNSWLEYRPYPPYPPKWHQLADAAVAADGKVFPLVRQSRLTCDPEAADWGVRYRTPVVMTLLPHLNDARELACLVADTAIREHLHGDDAAALELIRDGRHVARAAGAHPVLVCHLVFVGADVLALERLKVIAPALSIVDDDVGDGQNTAVPSAPALPDLTANLPTTRPSARATPATRSQVRTLIRELVDEADVDRILRRALQAERMMQLDTARWVTSDIRLVAPMFELDQARMLRADEALLEAARQPNLPAARALLAAGAVLPPPAPGPTLPLFAGMTSSRALTTSPMQPIHFPTALSDALTFTKVDRMLLNMMRLRADRRMAAVSLAVRLYRLDHAGDWPPTLQALVPAYLPAVPADPCAADGRPLAYLIARAALPSGGGDRPVVYSVGDNGVDDTLGRPSSLPWEPVYSWPNGFSGAASPPDQWCDLARWTSPKTQARDRTDAPEEETE